MSDQQTQQAPAMFAVDCNANLAIDHDGKSLALPAAEVIRLMDFLGAITYKGLVQRTEIRAGVEA